MLILSRVLRFARAWGMDLVAAYRAITGTPRFVKSMFEYKSDLTQSRFQLDLCHFWLWPFRVHQDSTVLKPAMPIS